MSCKSGLQLTSELMLCCCTETLAARHYSPASQSGVLLVPGAARLLQWPASGRHQWHEECLAKLEFGRLRLIPCAAAALQITINVPLTDKTRGMFNKETFAKMKVGWWTWHQ